MLLFLWSFCDMWLLNSSYEKFSYKCWHMVNDVYGNLSWFSFCFKETYILRCNNWLNLFEMLCGKTWENWKLSQFKGNSNLVARNSPPKVNKWGIRGLNPGSYILQHPCQLSYAHRTGSSFYYLGLNIFV